MMNQLLSQNIAWYHLVILFSLLLVVCVTDIRERRVPNMILGPFLILAFAVNYQNLLGSLVGLASALVLFLPFYVIKIKAVNKDGTVEKGRILGAGDYKLFCVVGALMGLQALLVIGMCAFLASAIIGTAWYLFSKNRRVPFVPSLLAGALVSIKFLL